MSFPTEVLGDKMTTEDGIILLPVCVWVLCQGWEKRFIRGIASLSDFSFSPAVIVRPVARNRGYRSLALALAGF
jgi:hypothetical protein